MCALIVWGELIVLTFVPSIAVNVAAFVVDGAVLEPANTLEPSFAYTYPALSSLFIPSLSTYLMSWFTSSPIVTSLDVPKIDGADESCHPIQPAVKSRKVTCWVCPSFSIVKI